MVSHLDELVTLIGHFQVGFVHLNPGPHHWPWPQGETRGTRDKQCNDQSIIVRIRWLSDCPDEWRARGTHDNVRRRYILCIWWMDTSIKMDEFIGETVARTAIWGSEGNFSWRRYVDSAKEVVASADDGCEFYAAPFDGTREDLMWWVCAWGACVMGDWRLRLLGLVTAGIRWSYAMVEFWKAMMARYGAIGPDVAQLICMAGLFYDRLGWLMRRMVKCCMNSSWIIPQGLQRAYLIIAVTLIITVGTPPDPPLPPSLSLSFCLSFHHQWHQYSHYIIPNSLVL